MISTVMSVLETYVHWQWPYTHACVTADRPHLRDKQPFTIPGCTLVLNYAVCWQVINNLSKNVTKSILTISQTRYLSFASLMTYHAILQMGDW